MHEYVIEWWHEGKREWQRLAGCGLDEDWAAARLRAFQLAYPYYPAGYFRLIEA